ncbi:MAG: poly(ADP-ribose) glycohydrolase ARH3 [Planctomycetota bacterium]|jgi:poly(ADP-ribose) glycohydrolase ARH3
MSIDRFQGCLLGLALGDTHGAPHEGGPIERLLWRMIGRTKTGEMRFTDDTQMSLDLAQSLLDRGQLDQDDLAYKFARSYRWSRGYGPGAVKLLRRIAKGQDWRKANRSVFPNGSWGNGGSMRAPVIGLWFCRRFDDLAEAARASAQITHAHPLGIQGAVVIASATALALTDEDSVAIVRRLIHQCEGDVFFKKLTKLEAWLVKSHEPSAPELRAELGNGMAAADSCVSALALALSHRSRSFEDLLLQAARIGGDVDTIGAMAGAIWGAANGHAALPTHALARVEQREYLEEVATALHEQVMAGAG